MIVGDVQDGGSILTPLPVASQRMSYFDNMNLSLLKIGIVLMCAQLNVTMPARL